MAASECYLNIYSKDRTRFIVTVYDYEYEKARDRPTIGQILATQACISNGITELTNLSGEILPHSADVYNSISLGDMDGANKKLYDATPAEKVTGFYLDGKEYKIGGDIAWGNISGTLSDQTDLNTVLSGKADSSDVNTKVFLLPSQNDDIADIITLLNNGGGVIFYKTYSELATVVGTRYYVVTDYNKQQGIIKAEGDIANATITLTSGTTTVASVTTGGENVKKFSLSSTSDTTTAEKVVDWYNGGNIPVVVYNGYSYTFQSYQYNSQNGKSYYTFWAGVSSTDDTSTSSLKNKKLTITYNPNGVVKTDIAEGDYPFSTYLRTGVDYSTPYTPEYNGSPATKKYVDDSVSGKANTSDITTKTYYTTGTMSVETFMDILNGLAANHIAPIIVYASNTTDIYYYDTGDVAGTSVSLYFYAPSNGVSSGTLYNKKLTVTYNMTAGTVTLTKSNESLAVGGGDMSYSDFNRATKTGATVTLDLACTITPSANFTVNAPSTIKDGQTYILRVNNGATAYTMTLGTNVTNPFDTDITLTANGVDQFVFLAIGGALELQPEGGGGGIAPAANSPINVKYIWAGTEAQYGALSSYDDNTVYLTV